MSQVVLLTDLDNTLYNWIDYFAPSFRAMVHVISRETGLSEEVITADFKKFYNTVGSLEYRYSIQQLDSCKHLPNEKLRKVVYNSWMAFSRTRRNRLRPYDGVRESLRAAFASGVRVIGVTNSPVDYAAGRLRQLQIDGFFYGLAGWQGAASPETLETWVPKLLSKGTSRIKRKWPLRDDELKPSPASYLRVMSDLDMSAGQVYVIGDSLNKDIAPALQIGANGVWAKYGTIYDRKNFETLLSITHWDNDRIKTTYDQTAIIPTFSIDSFSEIEGIIGIRLF